MIAHRSPLGARRMRLSTNAAQSWEMTRGKTIQTITASPSVAGQPYPVLRIHRTKATAMVRLANHVIRLQSNGMLFSLLVMVAHLSRGGEAATA